MIVAPTFSLAIGYFLGAILLAAAAHKVMREHEFRASLAGYGIIPAIALKPTTILLAVVEALTGLLFFTTIAAAVKFAAFLAVILFVAYSAMLVFGLASGRTSMGCGCEWGKQAKREPRWGNEPDESKDRRKTPSPDPIRPWMVWRSAILALAAAFLFLTEFAWSPALSDIGNALAAALVFFLLYSSLPGIFSAAHRIKSLRVSSAMYADRLDSRGRDTAQKSRARGAREEKLKHV